MEDVTLQIDRITTIFILIGVSVSMRLLLEVLGQRWITTIAHTATLVLLPIITFVITKVISGNIALSLGMVGALSIVRFRNPVRSPLELSVYFGAITMGIAASVNIKWLILLIGAVLVAALVLTAIHFVSLWVFNRRFFHASFSEGNSLSTLELTLSEDLDILDKSQFLKVKKFSNAEFHYVLVARKLSDLQDILLKLKSADYLKNYQLHK